MPTDLEWQQIRSRAASFPPQAYAFLREALHHTVQTVHGETVKAAGSMGADQTITVKIPVDPTDERRHVSGQQLCLGFRDVALQRYGLLAKTVLDRWGIRRTEDFGVLVYSMIDRGALRSSPKDRFEDFQGVFDFDEAFGQIAMS
ncbi:MAG: Minf_1886 family protein [Phycisphaerales bacterium]